MIVPSAGVTGAGKGYSIIVQGFGELTLSIDGISERTSFWEVAQLPVVGWEVQNIFPKMGRCSWYILVRIDDSLVIYCVYNPALGTLIIQWIKNKAGLVAVVRDKRVKYSDLPEWISASQTPAELAAAVGLVNEINLVKSLYDHSKRGHD